ncbi:hypothetical protein V6N13_140226 [Hibiscus sabdariffa]
MVDFDKHEIFLDANSERFGTKRRESKGKTNPGSVSQATPTPDDDKQCQPQVASPYLHGQNWSSKKNEPKSSMEGGKQSSQKPSTEIPSNQASREGLTSSL